MTFNDLSQWLIDYVATYPEKYNQIAIWREPIMACAPTDDRFQRLKEITVPDQGLPHRSLVRGRHEPGRLLRPFAGELSSINGAGWSSGHH